MTMQPTQSNGRIGTPFDQVMATRKREANKAEVLAEYKRAYREANKAELAEYKRAYREANKAEIAE